MTATYLKPGAVMEIPTENGPLQIDSIVATHAAIGAGARVEIKYYGDIIVRPDSIEELPPRPGDPPYKGLFSYTDDPADVDNFFGREQLSEALAARVLETRFLALVGESGNGKSSLLRAGLAPRLRRGNWLVHIITPAAQPLEQLATSLTRDDPALTAAPDLMRALADDPSALRLAAGKLAARANAAGLLLIVDQFEELFTQCRNPMEARQFVEALLAAGQSSGMAVVIALRAEFTGRLGDYPELSARATATANLAILPRLTQQELVRVIAEPARRGGWSLVEGLIEQILSDVGDEPGQLPLLSHALRELWERRSANVMTLRGYRAAGGVTQAIAATAEQTFSALLPDCQRLVRDIFLTLTEVNEAGPDTRRIAPRAELDGLGDPAAVAAALATLTDARLISTDKDTVQVAHEALIRRWPRLRDWIEQNRESLLFRRELSQMIALWQANGRHPDFLPRGRELALIRQRVAADDRALSEATPRFLAAAQEADEEEVSAGHNWRELPLVMSAGALGLGLSGYLLLTRWLNLGPFFDLAVLTTPSVVMGGIVGLFYGPAFDRALGWAEARPAWRWPVAALLGFVLYNLALIVLTLGAGATNYALLLTIGGAWGVVAGLGRAWALLRPARLAAVSLACGATLAALYALVSALELSGLWNASWGPPPPLLVFLAGALLPGSILAARWASYVLGQRGSVS